MQEHRRAERRERRVSGGNQHRSVIDTVCEDRRLQFKQMTIQIDCLNHPLAEQRSVTPVLSISSHGY